MDRLVVELLHGRSSPGNESWTLELGCGLELAFDPVIGVVVVWALRSRVWRMRFARWSLWVAVRVRDRWPGVGGEGVGGEQT